MLTDRPDMLIAVYHGRKTTSAVAVIIVANRPLTHTKSDLMLT